MEVTAEGLARFFEVVIPHMNEVQRRVVAGATAEMLGRGGKSAVAVGGGDKPLTDKQPGLLEALDEWVGPETRGNPMSMLRWTSKSSTNLAKELTRQGYEVVRPHGHPPLARARVLAAGQRQGDRRHSARRP